jgi:hypothetical protein
MDKQPSDKQRFAQQLPFYANRTLDVSEMSWMESYIADHPAVKKQLVFESLMRETAQRVQSPVPESQRLERLLHALQQAHLHEHWLRRWKNQFLAWVLEHRIAMPVPALAALVVVVIGQAVYTLGGLSGEPESSSYRGAAAPCVQEPRLRTVFNPDARHAEVLLLLRKVEATVRAGPTENGELWIAVPPSRSIEEAQSILRTSPLVDDVVFSPAAVGAAGCRP